MSPHPFQAQTNPPPPPPPADTTNPTLNGDSASTTTPHPSDKKGPRELYSEKLERGLRESDLRSWAGSGGSERRKRKSEGRQQDRSECDDKKRPVFGLNKVFK